MTNLNLVKILLSNFPDSKSKIEFVKDRLGHDFRYAIDITKVKRDLNWSPKYNFESGIQNTINWYRDNAKWLKSVTSGDYLKYYSEYYE